MAIVSWPYIPWRHFTLCTGYCAQCMPDCPCCRLLYMAYVDFIIGRNRRPVRANSRRYADALLSATAIKQPHTKRAINFHRQLQCVNYYNTMGCNVGSVRRPCGAECAFTQMNHEENRYNSSTVLLAPCALVITVIVVIDIARTGYEEHSLWNGRASVCPSVCPIARRRQYRRRCSAANAGSVTLTAEAEHRLVISRVA